MKLAKIVKRFCIAKPHKFRLSDYDPADTCGLDIEKAGAKAMLANGVKQLSDLHQRLYAQDLWSVLIVLVLLWLCFSSERVSSNIARFSTAPATTN